MQYISNAVIMAAGLGSRLGMDTPKCLVEVNGKKIIDYQLELLKDFNDIRIVIGFKEDEVINYVLTVRKDITFVRNPSYINTTNVESAFLSTRHITKPFILMDGDILINKDDFRKFMEACCDSKDGSIIGVTLAKTEEAVFAKVDNSNVVNLSTTEKYNHEWAGIAFFNGLNIDPYQKGFIYKVLEQNLPLKAFNLEIYEIDTPQDHILTSQAVSGRPLEF